MHTFTISNRVSIGWTNRYNLDILIDSYNHNNPLKQRKLALSVMIRLYLNQYIFPFLGKQYCHYTEQYKGNAMLPLRIVRYRYIAH
jgi:hypothetical protein